jgi:hypothetical protein
MIAVAGTLAGKHGHGGSLWVRMSWAEALRSLGFRVLFVEQLAAGDCVDAQGRPAAFEASANAATFLAVTEAFGFAGDAALVCTDGDRVLGMERDELLDRLGDAALLVNISGHLRWQPALARLPHRVFVDLDPAFTQIWHASGGDVAGLAAHDLHFTVGANVGTAACDLPTGGIHWRPIRQPVVLDRWPTPSGTCREFSGFTTVANWHCASGRPVWEGRSHGLKPEELRRYASLPGSTGLPFAVALDAHPADAAEAGRLRAGGWTVLDPSLVRDVEGFRRFVRRSGAEFSAAQDVYVETRSGWFSDRTVRYLAAGRPALVQDTGFSDHLPVGAGLVPFRTLTEARAGARAIAGDYERHCTAARAIATRCFAPAAALAPLLEATGVAP